MYLNVAECAANCNTCNTVNNVANLCDQNGCAAGYGYDTVTKTCLGKFFYLNKASKININQCFVVL
jgi:hypothetical protein